MNLICFATCIEGLFFFAAFAYVYFLRSKGLLNGLADGTNWVFRDESCHMNFALEVVNTVRNEEPDLFDDQLEADIREMLRDAVECEHQFAADVLADGVPGMSLGDTREYLQYVADTRLALLGYPPSSDRKTRSAFMELQDVQGALELLRAHRVELPDRHRRDRQLRRRLLVERLYSLRSHRRIS